MAAYKRDQERERAIDCRIRLTHADFVTAHHVVHGVSVLPGVAFLDLILRVLIARGLDHHRLALRDVLFSEPVVTCEGHERELRVTVDAADHDRPRRVRVESRWLRDGEPVAPWRENARAELVGTDEPLPAPLDLARLRDTAVREDDMDVLYARTRREGIRHGGPMTCVGRLYKGEPALLASLRLGRQDAGHEDGFHFHPAKADASTLVAFGQNEDVGAEPFIPFHIGWFRAPEAVGGSFHIHVAHPEVASESGDLVRNDYTLHDERGRLLVEFRDMTCKRIRHPELITRLLDEVRGRPAPVAEGGPVEAVADVSLVVDGVPSAGPVRDVVAGRRHAAAAAVACLKEVVAAALDRPVSVIPSDTGFYDLGLDSVALLRIGEQLQELVGAVLYPTLLFEYGSIDSLARHLADTYPEAFTGDRGLATRGTGADDTAPAEPDAAGPVTVCRVEQWADSPVPDGGRVGDVVLLGATEELAAEGRAIAERVAIVEPGTAFERLAPGAFRCNLADREQLGRLLGALADDGFRPGGYVLRPQDRPAAELWSLAAALVDARPTTATPVLISVDHPAAPRLAALAALAATVSAEVPLLRCRLVETEGPAGAALQAELSDPDGPEHWVRYRAGQRQTRRWAPVEPGAGGDRADGGGFADGGAYLITGGAGGLAGLVAGHLVTRHRARLMLTGRRPADAGLEARMAAWRNLGGDVRYVTADVSTRAGAEAAASATREAFGRVDGVLHCAGELRDGLFFRKDEADLRAVCAAKADGTVHLDAATADDDLHLFVLFSSVSAVLANQGQAEYAYANAFQLHFAHARAAARPGRTLAVAWPLWADGGMRGAESALRQSTARTGMVPLPTAVGLDLLDRGLAGGPPAFAVLHGDPARVPHLLPAPETRPATPTASSEPDLSPAHAEDTRGPDPDEEAVAIIGIAGRYPGAPGLDTFWRNLAEGVDSIVEVPADRWDHSAYLSEDRNAEGRTYSRWGGFLDGVDRFHPAFFGISRKDAERMDPQERLFLTASWHALENAGYPARTAATRNTGVFAGVMWNHYQLFADQAGGVAPTAMHASVANRVSYTLDLHGPSMAVDTACSSSLTALHLACESLRRGECELALAGGVNVTVHPQKYLQLAQGQFLSADGRCRSFGADGSGYVPGEGVGVVLLKPLRRARADGDHIHGVIRATVLNHTGRTSGYTVPSPVAQAELIRAALDRAGWDPATIGCVEAHGTGTALGDPIEVEALRKVFADAAPADGSVALGSVKSNIGHLESAAGIAGLTKVLLQFRHGELVPSLHSARTNPHIDFAGSPFRVPQERSPWPAGNIPRRAGVSAFGAGGASAHVLVEEEPPAVRDPEPPGGERLFVLSARNGPELRDYAGRHLEFLGGTGDRSVPSITERAAALLGVPAEALDPGEPLVDLGFDVLGLRELGEATGTVPRPDSTLAELAAAGGDEDRHLLTDLAYTSQVGRAPMSCRLAVIASDIGEVRAALRRYVDGEPPGDHAYWSHGERPRAAGEGDPGHTPEPADVVDAFRSGRLAEVAAYWAAGGDVDWAACHAGSGTGRRRPMPGYPFRQEVCWVGRWKDGDRAPAAPDRETYVPPALTVAAPEADGPPEPVDVGGEEVEFRLLDPGIALLVMRDAGGSNMFTDAMMRGLQDAFARIEVDDSVRAVVLTGTETVFSMGATPEGLETLAGGGSRFTDVPFVYEGMLRCGRPVISALRGHASGGGLAFGLFADIVVMARESVYGANFLTYGFTPGVGATHILGERLGRALAAEMIYTGRPYRGEELERRGADVRFADRSEVLATALGLARSIAEKPADAVRVLKRDLADRALTGLAPVIERESAMHERVFGSDSVDRIREHFRKVERFSSGADRSTGVHAAESRPAPVPAPVTPAVAETVGPTPAAPDAARITDVLHDVLCETLYLAREEIDPALSFNEMGLDSIGAVELVRALNKAFDLDIDSVAVYDHPTVPRLVAHVREVIARDLTLLASATAPAAEAVPSPLAAGAIQPLDGQVTLPPPDSAFASPESQEAPASPSAATVVLSPTPASAPPPVPSEELVRSDIAVIGMAGQFPDAPDLDAFWENLAAGRDSIREVPPERWDPREFYDPDRRAVGRTYSKWAALLDGIDQFDPQFFRMSPLEAAALDPQQRLFLRTAWQALEDAGHAMDAPSPRRWGVFVGCAAGEYLDLLRDAGQGETAHAFLGNSASVLAARIAYHLDLTGPTMAIDTACSSSLVAVHLACESIRSGECEAAVAGGVALMLTPRMHVLTSKTGMLSPTGRSAPFDASADGIVLGEGVGAVLLKRLDRAVADGDRIHGVIRGSGVNGDGRTNGITAPSAAGQSGLIERVRRQAGISPEDVTYVEAHGTGTPLGDPIEVKALDQVLGRGAGRSGDCGLGSVKGNIGHTTMAAGIAGLLKVLLALRHRQLPPSINYSTPNPEIDFERSRLRPVTELRPWRPGPSGELVGAVSSFGFSGTNAHLVVAEPPRRTDSPPEAATMVIPLSARSRPALVRTMEALADRLEAARPALADVAVTLGAGRAHHAVRAAFVVSSTDELVERLREAIAGVPRRPGTGPEEELAERYLAGEELDWGRLHGHTGGRRISLPGHQFDTSSLWAGAAPGPAATPAREAAATDEAPATADWPATDHVIGGTPLLPGVAVFELAARAAGLSGPMRFTNVQWLRPFGLTGSARRRPVAEVDGERFTLADGPVCARGRVVAGEPGGAGRIDPEAVRARCPHRRSGADLYAGFAAAGIAYGESFRALEQVLYGVDEALGVLSVPAARAAEVPGRPLHPVPLDAALQAVAVLAEGGDSNAPQVPFALSSLDVYGPVPAAGYAHVRREGGGFTVRLADRDGRVAVRFTGLVLRPARPGRAERAVGTARDAASPTVTARVPDVVPGTVHAGSPGAEGLVHLPEWRDAGPVPEPPESGGGARVQVVHRAGTAALADALVAEHRAAGDHAVAVASLEPGGLADVVYFLACEPFRGPAPERDPATLELFRTLKALISTGRPVILKVVLAGAVDTGSGPVRPHAAGLIGMVRSAAAEFPAWSVGCIDVGTGDRPAAELAALLRREPVADRVVALRDSGRLTRAVRPDTALPDAGHPYRQGGHYLILGGTGGIGRELAGHLARTVGARLTLVGRRAADARIAELLTEVARLGGQALYLRADATDPAALRAAVRDGRRAFGAVHGAFHAALVLSDRTLARMDEAGLTDVLAPKVAGAVAFGEILRTERPDFLAFFSSAVSFTDSAGQANYAAASTFEDAYAAELRRRCRFPVTVVNWGYWGSVGVVADERHAARLAGFGVGSIAPHEGMAALDALLLSRVPQALLVRATPEGLARLGADATAASTPMAAVPAAAGPAVAVEPGTADLSSADPVARARAAFAALERLAPELLEDRLRRELGSLDGTVEQLSARLGVRPDMQRLFDALLVMLETDGRIRRTGDRIEPAPGASRPGRDPETAADPETAPHRRLLRRCADAVPDVLAGRRRATEVLFPGGSAELVEQVYRGQSSADFYHGMLAEEAADAVRRIHRETGRTVRVVEVGAGTGASSAFVLRACAETGLPVEYRYTDISTAFLRRGEDAFAATYPFVRFETLDIERDPADQGFGPHCADLVLATNVLHATARMDRTLGHLRGMLAPGGSLLVNEVTRPAHFLTLTFGLTPGWWRYEDAGDRLPHAPLIGTAGWLGLLERAGFGSTRVRGFPGTAVEELEQCLFVATADGAGRDVDRVRGYVRGVFAEVLRFAEKDLDDLVTFENYGVDSLVSLDILARFEQDLGPLPATLLFEYLTIADLAAHFAETYPERFTATEPEAEPQPERKLQAEPGHGREPRRPHRLDPGHRDEDIAVIGVAGRYPGAPDVDAFWELLADGRSGITEIPADRWDWRTWFDPHKGRPQRSYSRWGGFLDGIDRFDPSFFGILPRDAAAIDPQERLFLETVWNLLDRAGRLGATTRERSTGVFVGTMYGSYGQLAATGWAAGRLAGAHSAYWSIANRVSYTLDLDGPSFAVDSACSSSLLAVHLACESIRRGECRTAVAGGVNLILHPAHHVSLCSMNMLSADGRCKVFDAGADGFVPGEGVGAVLLKPLREAVADGDEIWGVIKSGFTNAGGKTGGYTVPNPQAQASLIAEAVRRAGVDPATLGYVEAHGTGTELGDPIEVAGLSRALGAATDGGVRCAIGSVKANVGHLEGAAGIAGLTKVLLQLRHGRIAPVAGLTEVNPKIDLDPDRFTLPRELSSWPNVGTAPRRAGVSSFGAGGANVHLVLEEYRDTRQRPEPRSGEQLFVLSARTGRQLLRYAGLVAEYLDGAGREETLDAVCFTSQVGRREFAERLAVRARSRAELAGRLAAVASGSVPEGTMIGTASGGDIAETDAAGLAAAWVRGAPVDWDARWPHPRPRRAALPPYPFERTRHWLQLGPEPGESVTRSGSPASTAMSADPAGQAHTATEATTSPVPPSARATAPDAAGPDTPGQTGPAVAATRTVYRKPVWDSAPLPPTATDPAPPGLLLVVTEEPELADAFSRALEGSATACRAIRPGETPSVLPDAVVHSGDVHAFVRLVADLLRERPGAVLRAVHTHLRTDPEQVAAAGAIRTLALEHSGFTGSRVEFTAPTDADTRAALLLAELAATDPEVRHRDGKRQVKRLVEFTPPPAPTGPVVRPGGTYLITGGAGALALHVAEYLAAGCPVRLVLAGRSEPGPAASARIAALNRAGSTVTFHRADVTHAEDIRRLVTAAGSLDGVVHTAGVTRDALAVRKTRDEWNAVLAPKVTGTRLLDEATAGQGLDFFVLFSSVVGETGNPGQTDYATANAFLDAFAVEREELRRRGERTGRTVSIGWPLWADGGMTVDDATRTLFARRWQMVPMPTETGLEALRRALAAGEPSLLVTETLAAPALPSAEGGVPELAEVRGMLRRTAAGFLLVDESEVGLDDDLMDAGFDSIALTELISEVNQEYGLDLLPVVLFECASLEAFAHYLVDNHGAAVAAPAVPDVIVPDTVAAPPDAVAVVGIAGTLPGATDLPGFWRRLEAGEDLIGPAPADRLELHAHPDTAGIRGGFIDDVGAFDAERFRISPAEAALMDPQQRLFLQTVWRAIEDSGHRPESLAGSDTGLFVGVSTTDYADLLRMHDIPVQAHTASGIAHSVLANRVSHVLDLRGPSEAVDTACSSSLVALHRAVRAIASGDCALAVAGGVNVLLSPGLFTAFQQSGMLSPDGACKTFDRGADGYVRGEGVGAVVLKPLSAAEADGDHVYAVVRGTAVNHGGRAASLTAPNPEAQAQVLIRAYRDAGVDPRDVSAIEAHGTGTRLGDPVEVEGLKKAFAALYEEQGLPAPAAPHVALGSVKTNIGHLEAAAGIAGLLKTVLAMEHEVLPPSIHFTDPNPHLRLDGSPFHINDRARPWTGDRIAGVSSFGFGGTNAHVVLASRPRPTRTTTATGVAEPRLLVLSAPSERALRAYAAELAAALERAPEPDVAKVAYTLQTGRTPFRHRAAMVAGSVPEAVGLLRAVADGTSGSPVGKAAADAAPASAGLPLTELAARWVGGAEVPWAELWRGHEPGRTPLPGAPFDGRRHWFDDRAAVLGGPPPRRESDVPEETGRPRRRGQKLALRPVGPPPVGAASSTPGVPALATATVPAGAEAEPRTVASGSALPSARNGSVPATRRSGNEARVAREIAVQIADILGMAPDEIPSTEQFGELGLDSIYRMDLARRLTATHGVELQAADLYEHDSAELLSAHIEARRTEAATTAAQRTDAAHIEATPLEARHIEAAHVEPAPIEPAPLKTARTERTSRAAPTPSSRSEGTADNPQNPLGAEDALAALVEQITGHSLDRRRDFTRSGLTSFDMLRTISALERRFGSLRKTLLFDHPTLPLLAAHLTESYGAERTSRLLGEALAHSPAPDAPVVLAPAPDAQPAALPPAPAPTSAVPGSGRPVIVRKRQLDALPELAALLAGIDRAHAKEGGLAGRDIAPLAFVGSSRRAYFNFSRRDGDLFAWSYAGPEEEFAPLAAEWLGYADRHGLRPSFLSLIPLAEAGGTPITATPFGAVQRLEDLAGFTLSGGRMSRLRNLVARFERAGRVATEEYAVGTDPATDREIVDMIIRWGDQKQMVNPYVAVVREELERGRLASRHRMFLTRVNGELASAVIVTKIPSEPGYLLDLEFYPVDAPRGGLEYAIVDILHRLREEGAELFSFGASFGVKLADSPNSAPEVERGLAELRSIGMFGEGNFRFKNKFRPVNRPIYLCQRTDRPPTPVSEVILMIANPDIAAEVPGMVHGPGDVPADAPKIPAAAGTPVASPVPRSPRSTSQTAAAAAPGTAERAARLAEAGYNPLALRREEVTYDLVTDSWAELDDPFVLARARTLHERIERGQAPDDFRLPGWIPFDHALPTASGRAAEAVLCQSWPGPRGTVPHNGLFPTWLLSLTDAGFTPRRIPDTSRSPFPGDVDPAALQALLAAEGDDVAFVAVELSGNAAGGLPVSVAGLRAVRAVADAHGVPLVLDATRVLENAAFVVAEEEAWRGTDLWKAAEALLASASVASLSLSKDFGVSCGGLLVTGLPALAGRLRERIAVRGAETGLATRRLLARALAEQDEVAELVEERMAAVRTVWSGLREAGVPVAEPVGGHCVLLDVDRMERFAGLQHPVESALAWIYRGTGVRAAPHLGDPGRIRLAIPLGFGGERAADVAARLAALWRDDAPVPDLLPVGGPRSADAPPRFHPAAALPQDIEGAMREGHRARDDNAAVLAEHAPGTERRLLTLPEGEVEVFTAGTGPVLLLMTPFNIGAGVFAHQFAQLAGRYRMITVHHPGVGATTVRADLTLDGIASLYRTVLDRLGVTGEAHVLGASFGGLVAQSYALAHPESTASLTLVGSSYKVGNRNSEVNRLSIVAAEDFDRMAAHDGLPPGGRAGVEELLLRCESMDPQTGLSYLDVFAAQPTLFARLPEIAVPTLVLRGRHDTVIPVKAVHLLHGAIPDSRYHELADAGHFPCLTHPEDVHRLLLPFLAEHEPGGDRRTGSRG
ncbi:SDR family NAD(P)-dependent oxidoreductase [Streptomyces sp. NPDC059862]|uniref:SDR family NAD(P)-dependent oxidoreductase n=1 Tax=Streptomyces sp. NPDC059862 TaxID=3346975 RepID=UPI003657CEB2